MNRTKKPLLLNASKIFLTGVGFLAIGGCLTTTGTNPAFGQTAILGQESFDTLNETVLNGQNDWKSNGRATVQTQYNAQGGGKALKLEYPDGNANKVLVPQGATGILAVDFKLLLDLQKADPSAKVLVTLLDSDQKRITLFFHSEANQWGIKSGDNYTHVPNKGAAGQWQSIRLITNFNDKTVSAYAADGAKWVSLFRKVKFDTEGAKNLAAISVTRNVQGNKSPVYVDQITLQPAESDDPPAAQISILRGDTPAKPRFGVFNHAEPIEVVLEADRPATAPNDTFQWTLTDWQGKEVKNGTVPVSGGNWRHSLKFDSLPAGYYALAGKFLVQGDALPAQGSRPAGLLTFGVMPNIAPVPNLAADGSRVGMWGTNFIKSNEWLKGDPFDPLTTQLGKSWSSFARRWFELEPNQAGEWQPKSTTDRAEFNYALRHKMPFVVALEGMPLWNLALPEGVKKPEGKLGHVLAQAYPPRDWDAYADFLRRAAREQVEIRKQNPYLTETYYLIHHEPDWHWKGTDAEFVKMYQVAHKALHEADPKAVLLGPRYGVLKNGIANLERLFPLGLGKYMDGLGFHGYYLPPRISVTPESAGTPDMMKRLRELAKQYMKPNAMLAQLEWGVRYDVAYDNITSDVLRRHAAQTVRGHLIALGEGAQMSYLFYTSDYDGEPGYGLTFNLDMPKPNFGAIRTSPKPSYMASCALAKLTEGTTTIGRVQQGKVLGYSFKRGNQYLTALWSPSGEATSVNLASAAPNVQILDLMGKARSHKGGNFSLAIDDAPIYVLSNAPINLKN
jgi:hypothetical protein